MVDFIIKLPLVQGYNLILVVYNCLNTDNRENISRGIGKTV